MGTRISRLGIRKVFTGRGDLTVEVEVHLDDGWGRAIAPAGASRGKHEVKYFPDEGVDAAIDVFKRWVEPGLIGMDAVNQVAVDKKLEEIDGTWDFSKIGGAVAVATSMANVVAVADSKGLWPYQVIGGSLANVIPYPLGNTIGGGKHSRGLGPDYQEFLILPYGAPDIYTAVYTNMEVHREVGRILAKEDPTFAGGRNDEGAWTAKISTDKALEVLSSAVKEVSRRLGVEIGLGIDAASSSMWNGKAYVYTNEGRELTPREHFERIKSIIEKYDLIYIEDPFHEEDFQSFAELTALFKDRLIVGDDLFTTNPDRLAIGIREKATNAVLIKVDQIGTVTRAHETVRLALNNGYRIVVSHRSGDTESGLLAHIAVGFKAPIIKTGIMGSERVAKANELLRIWDHLSGVARMAKIK
ncbi:phosphopyruvate hydratase [Caldivirga maquilingensis]|uniref:Enolase n=1 Tax=Caldivirga maquilingensis (strain ATCC 700844 / DSM 13496 / JCM 10307 / IC-167) TaxID=397948 RepID=A8MAB4_CALMQ|nr:enolase C-terminal domain-like protein [Caldivirga maquilingensis]ABW01046.1 Phosphopyruvate hydratase [Caldivirga maquilingensis IC-167]